MTDETGDGWLDNYLPYLMYRVSIRLNARLPYRLRALDLNLPEWRILSVLRSYGGLSAAGIAAHSLMEQPVVNRVIAQLVQDGMVSKARASLNNGEIEIRLTPKADETFNEIFPAAQRHQALALNGFEAKEIQAFRATMDKIERNIAFER